MLYFCISQGGTAWCVFICICEYVLVTDFTFDDAELFWMHFFGIHGVEPLVVLFLFPCSHFLYLFFPALFLLPIFSRSCVTSKLLVSWCFPPRFPVFGLACSRIN